MNDVPRPAATADLAAVQALLTAAGLPVAGLQDTWRVWVTGDPGTPTGAVALERHPAAPLPGGVVFLLRSLVVEPEGRGQGLGRALVRTALDAADGVVAPSGPATVVLLTQTADDYVHRFGFTAVPREDLPPGLAASAEFTGACPASARAYRRG